MIRAAVRGAIFIAALASIALIGAASPQTVHAVDPTGPGGHWTFDEGSGTTAGDTSGNANDGALTGGTWTDGIAGTSAIHFDGDGDRIVVPDAAALEPANLGISFWIREDSMGLGNQLILRKNANGCASSYWVEASRNAIRLNVLTPGFIKSTSIFLGSPYPEIWDGEWHHVILNANASGSFWGAFLDGVRVGPAARLDSPITYSLPVQNLWIGRHPNCAGYGDFEGDLDDIRIYDRIVGAEEFQDLYDDIAVETTTTLHPIAPDSVYYGDNVVLSATVNPNPGGGTVLFQELIDGVWGSHTGVDVGTSGQASYLLPAQFLDPGEHEFRAVYAGAGTYLPSTSTETKTVTRLLRPSSMTLWATAEPQAPGQPASLMALFDPQFSMEGPVNFYRVDGDVDEFLGSGTPAQEYIEPLGQLRGGWKFELADLPLGTYHYRAEFPGNSEWAPTSSQVLDHVVTKQTRRVHLEGQEPTAEHDEVTFQFYLDGILEGQPNPWDATGIWTIRDTFKGVTTVIGTVPVNHGSGQLTIDTLEVGTHSIKARYGGDAVFAPSTSPALSMVITPDTAEFANPGLSLPKFYPVVDSYQDVVVISGDRQEQLALDIVISNSGGGVVRKFSFSRGVGSYMRAWDGRDSHGKLVPQGSYTVRQTFRDGYGNRATWTATVAVGHQKLVTKSGSVTLYADQFTVKGASTGAAVTSSSKYPRAIKLTAPMLGFAGVGYQFTLPSAVSYPSITYSVLGSGGFGRMGLHDWTAGVWAPGDPWVADYFVPPKDLDSPYAWTKLTGDPAKHRAERVVQGIVYTTASTYYVHKVQLSYTYQVLE